VRSERAAEAVRALPGPPEVRLVDWSDVDGLARATEGCEAVVHLVGVLKESPTTSYVDGH
jgi:hypothetical protein